MYLSFCIQVQCISCFSVLKKGIHPEMVHFFQFQATASLVECGPQLAGCWLLTQPASCHQWIHPLRVASQDATGHTWQGGVPQGSWLGGEAGHRSGVKSWGKAGWVKSWLENCHVNTSRQANEGRQFADASFSSFLSLQGRWRMLIRISWAWPRSLAGLCTEGVLPLWESDLPTSNKWWPLNVWNHKSCTGIGQAESWKEIGQSLKKMRTQERRRVRGRQISPCDFSVMYYEVGIWPNIYY